MAVQGLDMKLLDERCARGGIPAESQEVFQPDLETLLRREKVRPGDAQHLVSHGPERVEPQGLVSGGIGEDVSVFPVGLRDIIIHGVVEKTRHKASGRDRPSGMARGRNIVEKHRAEGAVDEVEPLEMLYLIDGEGRIPLFHLVKNINIDSSSGSECKCHLSAPFFGRLLKNAHLPRFPHPSSLRRTSKYTSFLRISGALHLGIFEQPAENDFSSTWY